MTTPTARTVEPYRLNVPEPIRTPRLLLRPHREGDGVALAGAIDESWETLHRWFHDGMEVRATETDPLWQEAIAWRCRSRFALRERLAFLAWSDDDALVGFVELLPDWRVGRMKLAYWIRHACRRQGYAIEAVGATTRYAFEALDARLVTVGHAAPNRASAALIARLGFERTAVQPLGHEMPDGTLVDGIGYAMTDPACLPPLAVSWETGAPSADSAHGTERPEPIPAKDCLLVIDMLNDFLDRWAPDARAALIERTNRLIGAYRAADRPVLWIGQAFRADLGDAFLEMRDRGTSITIEGTAGAEIHADLDRRASDVTITKKRYSAFFGTSLDRALDDLGIDHVTLAGVNTHACIRATAVDACQRDLRVTIASECVGSLDAEHGRVSLKYLAKRIGSVLSNASIIERLEVTAKRP